MVTLGPGPPEKTCTLPSASMTLRVPLRTNDFNMCDSGNMLPPRSSRTAQPERVRRKKGRLGRSCRWPIVAAPACAPPQHALPTPPNLAPKAVRYHDLRLPTHCPTDAAHSWLGQMLSYPPNLLCRAQLCRPCRRNGA